MMMVMMRGSAVESSSAVKTAAKATASAKAAAAASAEAATAAAKSSAAARSATRSCHISILQKIKTFFLCANFCAVFVLIMFIVAQICAFVNTQEINLLLKLTRLLPFFR